MVALVNQKNRSARVDNLKKIIKWYYFQRIVEGWNFYYLKEQNFHFTVIN
jgi:hypothetical protein